MKAEKTAVFGIFGTYAALETGVEALKRAGFRNADISVLHLGDLGSKVTNDEMREGVLNGTNNTPEAAATGGGNGVMVGGALGWLAGIGSLVIPGTGLLTVAGPIVGAIAGASAGGALGGVVGGLVGLGVSEREANHYQVWLNMGENLLAVAADNAYWSNRARELLELAGAHDISIT